MNALSDDDADYALIDAQIRDCHRQVELQCERRRSKSGRAKSLGTRGLFFSLCTRRSSLCSACVMPLELRRGHEPALGTARPVQVERFEHRGLPRRIRLGARPGRAVLNGLQ
jgi:hypothetical protein